MAEFTMDCVAAPTSADRQAPQTPGFRRVDQTFVSHGIRCGAWLYLPEGVAQPPVVVMAHGFGGQRWMRLPAYAERFVQRGMAVFVFDYRGFNDSDGRPRNYINPARHVADWTAAIAHVRSLPMVDAKRMALWGTSFSAGHVMVVAAHDPGISAIVLQVPFTDGVATALNYSLTFQLKCIYHGLRDLWAAAFSGQRHHVLIAGAPGGAFGMMSTPDALDGMMLVTGITDEKEYQQHNFCPADIAFTLTFYRPVRHAIKIACPALVIGAEKDSLFPPDGPRKAAARMPCATYISLPMTHFEPYVGEPFEELVVRMGDFLQTHFK